MAILKALEKEPDARFSDCREFEKTLDSENFDTGLTRGAALADVTVVVDDDLMEQIDKTAVIMAPKKEPVEDEEDEKSRAEVRAATPVSTGLAVARRACSVSNVASGTATSNSSEGCRSRNRISPIAPTATMPPYSAAATLSACPSMRTSRRG